MYSQITGSVNYSGVTVVWDLKAKKAVLNFSSPNRKLRCKAFAWNPDEVHIHNIFFYLYIKGYTNYYSL